MMVALAGVATELPAQEPDEEADGERCVCIDIDTDRIRDRVERTLDRVDRIRVRMPPRARLGVVIGDSVSGDAGEDGVRVLRVPEGGPAAGAGIEADDVIVALDGHALADPLPEAEDEEALDEDRPLPPQRLVRLLDGLDPGDEVDVEYVRDGERRTATVALESPGPMRFLRAPTFDGAGGPPRPPTPPRALRELLGDDWSDLDRSIRELGIGQGGPVRWAEACRELGGGGIAFLSGNCVAGLRVSPLNEDLGEYFGTSEGVLVLEVAEGSTLGVRPGDVILAVGDRSVDGPADLRRILRSYETDEAVRFRVVRRDRELEVTGTAP